MLAPGKGYRLGHGEAKTPTQYKVRLYPAFEV